jgi:hypothetical protein
VERRTPLKRTGLRRGTSQLKRTRLQAVSKRREAEWPARTEMREQVFDRDGRRCVLAGKNTGPCSGTPLTPHHLLKSGQGGPYTLCNLVTLCAGHNTWVEDHPPEAYALGLVIRRGETFDDAWELMVKAGLVAWWWHGAPA